MTKSSPSIWHMLHKVKSTMKILSNFVAFLENINFTGKSFLEALIHASVNPQYDKRLFIKFPEKYKYKTCCVQKLFFCFDIWNNICRQHVLNLYFLVNSMNNLSSYFGLTDSRMRYSDTDLPVPVIAWLKGQTSVAAAIGQSRFGI